MRMCTYGRLCVFLCGWAYSSVYAWTSACAWIGACVSVCVIICANTRSYVCLCVRAYIYCTPKQMHMYVCVCTRKFPGDTGALSPPREEPRAVCGCLGRDEVLRGWAGAVPIASSFTFFCGSLSFTRSLSFHENCFKYEEKQVNRDWLPLIYSLKENSNTL